ncbi:Phosphatidylinositol N-acetylglucosaminyltransferase subunit Q [Chlorella sorokiniana]|uniref:Phosphatidylinositol N-acetylglucosaminyltransferase subunit Q n=1 Tax=Chlorella sorokiniana TaxID=3076 RepID=A0A2P6U0L7_CHLSO|nr:Phosphatidylinositol N-acetylglucosaminyltransferase subunit Q [Chlorella sorokiniana]|eukprot:PRW59859.1 Phosphatidylinositol N-acetylglucosaminyltransferase subunit Q [Chlorella sorokiniana]
MTAQPAGVKLHRQLCELLSVAGLQYVAGVRWLLAGRAPLLGTGVTGVLAAALISGGPLRGLVALRGLLWVLALPVSLAYAATAAAFRWQLRSTAVMWRVMRGRQRMPLIRQQAWAAARRWLRHSSSGAGGGGQAEEPSSPRSTFRRYSAGGTGLKQLSGSMLLFMPLLLLLPTTACFYALALALHAACALPRTALLLAEQLLRHNPAAAALGQLLQLGGGSSEFSELMQVLHRLHTGERGIMLQDLSSNNLLVQDRLDGSCRLLLADPSICFLMSHLTCPDCRYLVSTWLWGALGPRHKCFDPTADNYSLSFCFLELWLCAEGAPVPLFELVQMSVPFASKSQGHTFVRALCVAVLKRRVSGRTSLVPRIRRELPVSWLMLWLLLLGTEDYTSKAQLDSQQMHRRPAEADMVAAAAELAGVAADVEALSGGLTAESLATPAGEALVARCLRLYERLTRLSQLEPPQGSPLVPLDASLSWVATHFMAQDHPLVAAMRAAQGCKPISCKIEAIPSKQRDFRCAVQAATVVAGCDPCALIAAAKKQSIAERDEAISAMKQAFAAGDGFQQLLGNMCQEYGRVRDVALQLLPPHADRRWLLDTSHLHPDLQQYINQICPPGGAAPPADAAQPPATAVSPPDLSSRTVAGGPGDVSPATSGGSCPSSPNKRKRGAAQSGPVVPRTTLRFAASRDGCIAGLPAFRLPPNTIGSNLYAYVVVRWVQVLAAANVIAAHLSERFRGDVHLLLAQRQGPYSALLAASGLQPAQLDSLVANSGGSDTYIEVSATSFLPGASAADHAAAAPIILQQPRCEPQRAAD